MRSHSWLGALALTAGSIACGPDDGEQPSYLSVNELRDPATCGQCHADHTRQWSGSMHAYAAKDPVFLAMNARGQRETQGQLGDFCVQCHAPLAVESGWTKTNSNLAELPEELSGVNCYFCHNVQSVADDHNNPLELRGDNTMLGGIRQPVDNTAHRSAYSPLLARNEQASSTVCGACHDIVTPSPPAPRSVHLERTFEEWQTSLFSAPLKDGGLSCNSCHMEGREGVAADYSGVKLRRVHDHSFPAVDLALTPFPERESQRSLVQRELDLVLRTEICVAQLAEGAIIRVLVENLAAGHHFPSGAAHDRRAWVEVIALDGDTEVYSSGVVADGQPVTSLADPDLWLMRDEAFDAAGKPAHMFWDIASIQPNTVPGPLTFDRKDPDYFATHVSRRYPRATSTPSAIADPFDRVTVRVRVRPVGLDVLDDLVDSGDLDPKIRDEMPTFDLIPDRPQAVTLTWSQQLSEDPLLGSRQEISGSLAACVTNAPAAR